MAQAEPSSIRCGEDTNKEVYFVTYDLNVGHFVFESPARILSAGEIAADGARLELSLNADRGKLDYIWDGTNKTLTTIGAPSSANQLTTRDECDVVAPRSIMELYGRLARRQ